MSLFANDAGSPQIAIGRYALGIEVGAAASVAATGDIRLRQAASQIVSRNHAGSGDIPLIGVGSSDQLLVGDPTASKDTDIYAGGSNALNLYIGSTYRLNLTSASAFFNAPVAVTTGGTPAASGSYRLENNTFVAWRNAANNADVKGILVDSSNNVIVNEPFACLGDTRIYGYAVTGQILFYNGLTNTAAFGASTSTLFTPLALSSGVGVAGTGKLRLENGDAITWRNGGNSGDISGIAFNSSNVVVLNTSSGAGVTLHGATINFADCTYNAGVIVSTGAVPLQVAGVTYNFLVHT